MSTLKSKTYIPQIVWDIVNKPADNPDEDPGENNIVEVRCMNAYDSVLAYGSFVTPTRQFSGTIQAQATGHCKVIKTRIYWAVRKVWVPDDHYTNDPTAGFQIFSPHLHQGDSVRVTGRIVGDAFM